MNETSTTMKMSDAERRRETRDTTQLKVSLSTPGGQSRDVVTKDQSLSGISFLTAEPLGLGQDCHVTLENADKTFMRFVAKVIRCRPMPNGQFDVAVQFRRQIAA